jgi:proprotein convertase subtilisin/kexin type 5
VECTDCTTVGPDQYYFYLMVCYSPCPTHTFPQNTTSSNCTDCDAVCAECWANAQNCSTCAASHYFPSYGSSLCVPSCESNEYLEVLSNTCTVCPTGCTACEKPSTTVECTSCSTVVSNEYYYYQTLCYQPCPTHTFPSLVPTPNCTDCDVACADCTLNSTNCGSCASSYYFPSNGSSFCVSACETNEYLEVISNICTACPTGCTTCEKLSTTVECTSLIVVSEVVEQLLRSEVIYHGTLQLEMSFALIDAKDLLH